MLVVLVSLLVIVVAAGLVVAYVAYPHRGRDVPTAVPGGRRLSAGMRRVVDRAGLDPDVDDAARGGSLTGKRDRRPAGTDAGRDA